MPRLLFFGMSGLFSIAPLEYLIEAGVAVGAVVMPVTWPTTEALPRRVEPHPANESNLPVINPYLSHNIIHIAWEHNIPIWEVGALSNEKTLKWLTNFQPDVVSVACFPYIFPPELLQLPQYGCLNLHPSLLPAYRGPEPLFWMARNGEPQAGITLHFLDEGVDTGDIVSQTAFAWPEGISGPALERRCSVEGAKLLVAAVQQLEQQGILPRQPQAKQAASYFPHPAEEDFLILPSWDVRRAFNFLRAAEEWPLIIDLGSERFFVRQAIRYKPDQTLEQPYIRYNEDVWIQFNGGVLKIQI